MTHFLYIQVRVRATDGGGLTGETRVVITVNRNLNSPAFDPTSYSADILENQALATSIAQVNASDNDVQVSGISK